MLNLIYSLLLVSSLAFTPPVNYPISLAGNFGEPRPNHFHGGIDVRTGMVEGKPVFSVYDGYVSRVTIGLDGFGIAVYVRHPGGTTSVYCHLKKLVPQLAAIARKWQYQHETCFADVRLRPTDFPVASGQFIAVSGNTGASRAPHLHFEMHDTKTWSFLDPLDYLKDYVTDTTPPIAHAFMAYPVEGEGVFCGSGRKQNYGFSSTRLTRTFTAWGKVGFGLWANDYMEGSFGILGVRRTTLTVDGKLVFESDVDSIPVMCNRMVNSWGDYLHYCRSGVWYMKSYADFGNTLPILCHYTPDRGVVLFNEERDYNLEYTVSDVFGNSRSYTFTVRGVPQRIPVKKPASAMNLMSYNRANVFQRPGLTLVLPQGVLAGDVELAPSVKDGVLSKEWRFYNESHPLFSWANINIKLEADVPDPRKLYIISKQYSDGYMGGTFKDGWVTGRIRDLGLTYTIGYDDEPPVLMQPQIVNGTMRVVAYDKKCGLKALKAYVDGRFVLFERQDKSNIYVCRLADAPVRRTNQSHVLTVICVDNRGNECVRKIQFNY